MPFAPAKPCRHPGCAALTHDRFCADHAAAAAQRFDQARGSAHRRGYGRRWRALRETILARDIVCRWPGCTAPATEVDHIVPKPAGTDDPANLQGLCKAHHSAKTAREDGGFGRPR
ncbi:MAG: HNH endonuclease [Rhodospirillaceae bacterium]